MGEKIRKIISIFLGIAFSSCITALADTCTNTLDSSLVNYQRGNGDYLSLEEEIYMLNYSADYIKNVDGNFADALLNTFYPVGTIYITTSNTNPGATLGGTWVAFGQGRTVIGVGQSTGTSNYKSAGLTGGSERQSYTPSGTSSGPTIANHTYTPTGTVGTWSIADHDPFTPQATIEGHALTIDEMPAHKHDAADTTFSFISVAAAASISKSNSVTTSANPSSPTTTYYVTSPSNSYNFVKLATTADTGGGQPHTHSLSCDQVTLSSHTISSSAQQLTFTGTQATLTHNVTPPTFTGTATNISHMQPYITVYMWRRAL